VAERYYLRSVAQGREEYYTGSGESPGVWVGRGAAHLGLDGTVSPADLQMVLAGYSPQGERLAVRRVDPARRVAAPHLLGPQVGVPPYALGDETSPRGSGTYTTTPSPTRWTTWSAGRFGCVAVPGEPNGSRPKLVAASFLHRTSRAGDPQLHSHVLVANVALGRTAGGPPPTPVSSITTPAPPASSTRRRCGPG
jgi:hypothetical protein